MAPNPITSCTAHSICANLSIPRKPCNYIEGTHMTVLYGSTTAVALCGRAHTMHFPVDERHLAVKLHGCMQWSEAHSKYKDTHDVQQSDSVRRNVQDGQSRHLRPKLGTSLSAQKYVKATLEAERKGGHIQCQISIRSRCAPNLTGGWDLSYMGEAKVSCAGGTS